MTTAPSYVAVKRKRDDAPIQSLILEERRTKHARINVEYRLESISQSSNSQPGISSTTLPPQVTPPATASLENVAPPPPPKPSGPRHFELATTSGKRSADAAGLLPTFVERPAKRPMPFSSTAPAPPGPQKRPGTRSATNGTSTRVLGKGAEPSASLTAALHAFAMQEAEADGSDEEEREAAQQPQSQAPVPDKPRVIVQPKRAVRRAPRKDADAMDTDEEDYVYDIYLLAGRTETAPKPPAPSVPAAPLTTTTTTTTPAAPTTGPIDPSAPRTANLLPLNPDSTAPGSVLASLMGGDYNTSPNPDVGYLILPTNDEESSYFWGASAPLHHNASSSDDEGDADDDDDSNAEDYYAADYPEDEIDADDEMGVGEWRYRNRGVSDDEDDFADVPPAWGNNGGGEDDGGAWSDSSIEADRSMNPWRRFGGRTE